MFNIKYISRIKFHILAIILTLIFYTDSLGVSWDWAKWWTYDGISGPQFWGLINPEWSLCTHGRRQSPINVDPSLLLYDPNLRHLHVDKHKVTGILNNTGHSILFSLDTEEHRAPVEYEEDPFLIDEAYEDSLTNQFASVIKHNYRSINISGGSLSYKYQVSHVQFHFGSSDSAGSEHTVNGTSFPAEIYGFNCELFSNFSEAVNKAHGVVGISVLIQIGDEPSPGLKVLTEALQRVRYAETWAWVEHVSLRALLPDTHYYITYDGSLTQPPCHETVSWLIMNKPIYVTKQQMHAFRQLRQGNERMPKARLLNNYRPVQPLLGRPLRTNIDFNQNESVNCPSMGKKMHYKANTWR